MEAAAQAHCADIGHRRVEGIFTFTYVELKDASGAATTEVLVDPSAGAVATENGTAMMWNTGNRTAAVSADQAVAIADRWLQATIAGQTAGAPEA